MPCGYRLRDKLRQRAYVEDNLIRRNRLKLAANSLHHHPGIGFSANDIIHNREMVALMIGNINSRNGLRFKPPMFDIADDADYFARSTGLIIICLDQFTDRVAPGKISSSK